MTKTAFISGHRDVTIEEFEQYYVQSIKKAIEDGDNFVIGDYQGVDYLAQKYLFYVGYENVIVYHMFKAPRNHVQSFVTRGGYISDEDRDSAMTKDSDYDIAWIRPGKKKSGTEQNINRRANLLKVGTFGVMLDALKSFPNFPGDLA